MRQPLADPVSVMTQADGWFRLPIAPSMKIFCLHGHGKETEVCRRPIRTRSALTSPAIYFNVEVVLVRSGRIRI